MSMLTARNLLNLSCLFGLASHVLLNELHKNSSKSNCGQKVQRKLTLSIF